MPILILILSFLTLLFLVTKVRVNAFFALLIAAIVAALLNGMSSGEIIKSLTTGIGETLGNLILIITFGAMLGKLLQTSGAANKITRTLVEKLRERNIQISIIIFRLEQVIFTDDTGKFLSIYNRQMGNLVIIHEL